ncbi:hypothetical protein GCM10009837_43200 [Streptomyces durmitorensis]|uniref:Uncharacterized protein n=1 Tax=Streptomyces durmitorensis TaxID=319947 RepID=A0ABY4Q3B6_9ACTN|nr:hypothetical protein [Streptomyces durmitorensis]UQT60668.1 hypothetical protein M4V62_39465 [Streptomyces durmitorensis]
MNDPLLVAQLLAVHGTSRPSTTEADAARGRPAGHGGSPQAGADALPAEFNTFNNTLVPTSASSARPVVY